MTDFKWCQRCGDKSNGKEFCLDCNDRLKKYEEWKKNGGMIRI